MGLTELVLFPSPVASRLVILLLLLSFCELRRFGSYAAFSSSWLNLSAINNIASLVVESVIVSKNSLLNLFRAKKTSGRRSGT